MYYNVNKEDGSLIPVAGGTLYADNPIGSIIPFGGTVAPSGFFLCQGEALSRTEYADLFKAIGTSFGAGDGSTTFNIPDFRGEFLRGAGANSHSGQGNGSSVGTHQDATKKIALTKDGPTYQYLQNETGHTGPQSVTSTYTSRPTNTSVNYIIKAKHTPVPTDFMDAVAEAMADPYSTAEVKTNKVWIDGKPIYRKAIAIRIPSPDDPQTFLDFPTGLTNANYISLIGHTSKLGSSNVRFTFPLNWVWMSTMYKAGAYFYGDNIRVCASQDTNQAGGTGYAIIEYTKTN